MKVAILVLVLIASPSIGSVEPKQPLPFHPNGIMGLEKLEPHEDTTCRNYELVSDREWTEHYRRAFVFQLSTMSVSEGIRTCVLDPERLKTISTSVKNVCRLTGGEGRLEEILHGAISRHLDPCGIEMTK